MIIKMIIKIIIIIITTITIKETTMQEKKKKRQNNNKIKFETLKFRPSFSRFVFCKLASRAASVTVSAVTLRHASLR